LVSLLVIYFVLGRLAGDGEPAGGDRQRAARPLRSARRLGAFVVVRVLVILLLPGSCSPGWSWRLLHVGGGSHRDEAPRP